MSIVGVSGGLSSPSRTYGLVQAIINELNEVSPQQGTLIDFASVATAFGSVLSREQLNFEQEALLQRIEAADILVVAVPVYRAAYPGLFKHLFDLVERDALERKVVILAANGGSAHHALIIESHLRGLGSNGTGNALKEMSSYLKCHHQYNVAAATFHWRPHREW
jgi:FMN reductase